MVLKTILHGQMSEKTAKNVKNCLFKMHFVTTSKNVRQTNQQTNLHNQMTEKIAFEVRPKKGKKLKKVLFLKSVF